MGLHTKIDLISPDLILVENQARIVSVFFKEEPDPDGGTYGHTATREVSEVVIL